MRILLTGATGFVGAALLARLIRDARYSVRAALRHEVERFPGAAERTVVGSLGPDTDWRSALDRVDTVVHLAARVHVMRDEAADPLSEFRRVNVAATLNLARQAATAGVRRFVYLSSVKVNGEETRNGQPFRPDDPAHPLDDYGTSKHEAEVALHEIASATGMQVVIIRPPLVYGPGVKANFKALMRAVARGVPLPLGAIHNRRSLVALDNLVDFIITCIEHPAAAGQTFLVSDDDDLSTPDVVRHIARAMGRSARLVPVPPFMLGVAAALIGRRAAVHRLCGSLQVEISKSRTLLGWNPPLSVDEGFSRAVEDFARAPRG